jgi:5-methylcytosine-specific restriction protein A
LPPTTAPGSINDNGQEVLGATGQPGTDHLQQVYVLLCRRCGHEYGANGSDLWQRRCPACEGGAPGFPVTAANVVQGAEDGPPNRNPNWTRDELILALDLYFDHPSPDQTHPAVAELSALLNRFWSTREHRGVASFRNPSGVSMKHSKFQRLDPRYQGRGRRGLAHGARLDEEVWNDFAGDRQRLRSTAHAIRAVIDQMPELTAAPDATSEEEAEGAEGTLLTRLHHYRERDGRLVRRKKAEALKRRGRLACEACGFTFREHYCERGDGYIEAHHTMPLEALEPGSRTKLSDLALLCANCHRMVHARRPWLSMAELVAIVRKPDA